MELTAIILTLNEANHLPHCIASLHTLDQIVVFDSFSTDNTIEIAKANGATVYQNRFENYAQQRNAALASVNSDWILFIDADERLTPALSAELRQVTTHAENGWEIPRHNYIFGRLTHGAGWWPDHQLRFFRQGKAHYQRAVHEIATVEGEIGRLQHPLIHYNYDTPAQFHAKQRRYVAYDAQLLREEGVVPRPHTPYTQAIRHFWWRFVTLQGYRVGLHGAYLSGLMAFYEWKKVTSQRNGIF